jgi:hypothetical protein
MTPEEVLRGLRIVTIRDKAFDGLDKMDRWQCVRCPEDQDWVTGGEEGVAVRGVPHVVLHGEALCKEHALEELRAE